jgi:hypothetical protein
LYSGAIRRTRRTVLHALAKNKYEVYLMFQIVLSHCKPVPLYQFLSAALFLSTGNGTYPDLRILSEDQMHRRLYSRSAGLLEAVGQDKKIVQFNHQTLKEYILGDEGEK